MPSLAMSRTIEATYPWEGFTSRDQRNVIRALQRYGAHARRTAPALIRAAHARRVYGRRKRGRWR